MGKPNLLMRPRLLRAAMTGLGSSVFGTVWLIGCYSSRANWVSWAIGIGFCLNGILMSESVMRRLRNKTVLYDPLLIPPKEYLVIKYLIVVTFALSGTALFAAALSLIIK